jgi:cell division septation protein DedD
MTISRDDDQEGLEELGQRYELLHRLREEPWGEVWLATDRLLHTETALKILPRTDPDWDLGQKILAREAVWSLTLRHPLILGVFFLGEGEDGLYLVEEAFTGESLMARLSRKHRFSGSEVLSLLEQVSQALAFAHQRGVAHQTLNPLHILLKDDEVRVANFACPAGADEEGRYLELKAYTPPEVLHGDESSPAGNVFSLGVLGYRLLSGSLPYPLTFDEPFPYRLETMPVDLEEIPLPLQNLLLQSLAPEPEDRFADAGLFLTQLRQLRDQSAAGSREIWLESEGSPAAWRQFGSGARGILGKIGSAGKFCGAKLSGALGALRSRQAPASRRLWWGLGLAGMLVILIFLGVQIRQHSSLAPEPSPITATPAAPGLNAGPPLLEPTEPAVQAEPAPRAQAAPGPTPTLATPPPAAAPKVEKTAAKKDRYLVIAGTFAKLDQAKALSKRLQSKKYHTQVTKMVIKGKTTYLVRLGPFTEKKKAEETAKRLRTREHLQSRLVQLKPKPHQASIIPGGTR